jgi:NTP pyrophosphatase (non-canonical NTP hydrolase)
MITHPELVAALCKPGEQILSSLTSEDAHVWHMSSCLCGESGELFDAIKKHVIYRKPYDRENIIEELGDIEFYLEGLRKVLNITRQMTLDANIAKLSKRYEELKYSDAQAQGRADKRVGVQSGDPAAWKVGVAREGADGQC